MELNFYSAFIELCFLRGLAGFGKGFVFLCQNMARDVSMAANQQNKMLKTNEALPSVNINVKRDRLS